MELYPHGEVGASAPQTALVCVPVPSDQVSLSRVPAAGKLPVPEPKQTDKHNPGAVQSADLQGPGLPGRRQRGAQVWTSLFMSSENM